MPSAPFVNRENELKLIEEAFDALTQQKQMLRTPILELYGIGGIGKTSLLRQIEKRCHTVPMPCVWVDIKNSERNVGKLAQQIVFQVQKYISTDDIADESSPVAATRALLNQQPTVMLFDALDMASQEQLHELEMWLRDLIDDDRLFVVLASKKELLFRQERTVARKLTALALKSLDKKNCEAYLHQIGGQINAQLRDITFDWTRGYPLAMNVMAQAISSGLDPRTEQGTRDMLALLKTQVIEQYILSGTGTQRDYYMEILQLFSIPRRFNLTMMEDLIKEFGSTKLQRENSLAYFSLPREINEATNVLNYNMARAGYSINAPVRNILLLLVKSENPTRYFKVHEFLANINREQARDAKAPERMRYLREYLYHVACNTTLEDREQLIISIFQQIENEPIDAFSQFSEEFSRDEELKEVLGPYLVNIQALIDRRSQDLKG